MVQLSDNREAGLFRAKSCVSTGSAQPAQIVGPALGHLQVDLVVGDHPGVAAGDAAALDGR